MESWVCAAKPEARCDAMRGNGRMEVSGRVVLEDSRCVIRALSGNHSVRSMGNFVEIPGDGLCSVLLGSRPGDVVVDVRSESAAMSSTTQRKSSVEDVTTSCWPGVRKEERAWSLDRGAVQRLGATQGAWRRRVYEALPNQKPRPGSTQSRPWLLPTYEQRRSCTGFHQSAGNLGPRLEVGRCWNLKTAMLRR